MALTLPSYTSTFNVTLTNAYGYIAGLALDMSNNNGLMTLNIHPTVNDWTHPPIGQINVTLGQKLTDSYTVPDLNTLMSDTQFAAAFSTIATKLYEILQNHPSLTGATIT